MGMLWGGWICRAWCRRASSSHGICHLEPPLKLGRNALSGECWFVQIKASPRGNLGLTKGWWKMGRFWKFYQSLSASLPSTSAQHCWGSNSSSCSPGPSVETRETSSPAPQQPPLILRFQRARRKPNPEMSKPLQAQSIICFHCFVTHSCNRSVRCLVLICLGFFLVVNNNKRMHIPPLLSNNVYPEFLCLAATTSKTTPKCRTYSPGKCMSRKKLI